MRKDVELEVAFEKFLTYADYKCVSGNCDTLAFQFHDTYKVLVMNIGGTQRYKVEISLREKNAKKAPFYQIIQIEEKLNKDMVIKILNNVKRASENQDLCKFDFLR